MINFKQSIGVLTILLISLATVSCNRQTKYGFIDIQQIVNNHPRMIAFRTELQNQKNQYEQLRKTMVAKINTLKNKFDTLPEGEEKTALGTELTQMVKKLQLLDQQTLANIRRQQAEITNDIIREVNQAAERFRTVKNLTALTSNPEDPNALGAENITKAVFLMIQKEYMNARR